MYFKNIYDIADLPKSDLNNEYYITIINDVWIEKNEPSKEQV